MTKKEFLDSFFAIPGDAVDVIDAMWEEANKLADRILPIDESYLHDMPSPNDWKYELKTNPEEFVEVLRGMLEDKWFVALGDEGARAIFAALQYGEVKIPFLPTFVCQADFVTRRRNALGITRSEDIFKPGCWVENTPVNQFYETLQSVDEDTLTNVLRKRFGNSQ